MSANCQLSQRLDRDLNHHQYLDYMRESILFLAFVLKNEILI